MSTACAVEAEARALMEALAAVDIPRLPWPEAPPEEVMEVLRFLLDGSLTERPRRGRASVADTKNLAWCFVADRNFKPVPLRTFETLKRKLDAGAMYFTPNTFFCRRAKSADRLRWLNALWADLDDPELTLPDVLAAAAEAGLPPPTLVSKTPHGLHAYWKLTPVRATERAVRTHTALLRAVARVLDGDLQAASPEHFLRIPRRLVYFTPTEYELQHFLGWCNIWETETRQDAGGGRKLVVAIGRDILGHPALVRLWEGVPKGIRNNTCFTLALALRMAGWSYEDARSMLRSWNKLNRPPLPDREVTRTVTSAYRGRYHAPAAAMVRYLSGVDFRYRVFAARERTGRPRGRPRLRETVREKFLELLRVAGGSITVRSQAEIAARLGCSRATFARVLRVLLAEKTAEARIRRLGKAHGAEITYSLCQPVQAAYTQKYNTLKNVLHVGGGGRVGRAPRTQDQDPGSRPSAQALVPVPRRAPRRPAAQRRTGPCPTCPNPATTARPPPAQQF